MFPSMDGVFPKGGEFAYSSRVAEGKVCLGSEHLFSSSEIGIRDVREVEIRIPGQIFGPPRG